MNRSHHAARVRRISKNRIAQETLLVRERGSGTRISLELFLGDMPGRLDNLGMEFGSNETIKQAVMAGLGLGFISVHTIAMEVELGRLVILDVVDTPVRRQWFLVSRTDRTDSPTMTAFRDFVVRRGRDFLPRLVPPGVASPEHGDVVHPLPHHRLRPRRHDRRYRARPDDRAQPHAAVGRAQSAAA